MRIAHLWSKGEIQSQLREALAWLPGYVQSEILAVAVQNMPGHIDLSRLEELLRWYQFIFEKARYHYELYEDYTFAEQRELGKYWVSIGAPTEEAVVQYHPR